MNAPCVSGPWPVYRIVSGILLAASPRQPSPLQATSLAKTSSIPNGHYFFYVLGDLSTGIF